MTNPVLSEVNLKRLTLIQKADLRAHAARALLCGAETVSVSVDLFLLLLAVAEDPKMTGALDDMERRFWAKTDKRGPDDCWLWRGSQAMGYGQIRAARVRGIKAGLMSAHKAAWIVTHGEVPPPGMVLMHKCDTPLCVNPAHLSLGMPHQNVRDMVDKGRANRVGHPTCTISPEVRQLIADSTEPKRTLARKLGISARAVYYWKEKLGPKRDRTHLEEVRS